MLGPYLETLGVSEAYLLPYFKSGPGSSHGYDGNRFTGRSIATERRPGGPALRMADLFVLPVALPAREGGGR